MVNKFSYSIQLLISFYRLSSKLQNRKKKVINQIFRNIPLIKLYSNLCQVTNIRKIARELFIQMTLFTSQLLLLILIRSLISMFQNPKRKRTKILPQICYQIFIKHQIDKNNKKKIVVAIQTERTVYLRFIKRLMYQLRTKLGGG